MTASQIDLVHQEVLSESDALKVHEARKRAYSGDGRKSYFTFDHEDVRKHQNMRKTRTNDYDLKCFSVAKATLQSHMSVRLLVS